MRHYIKNLKKTLALLLLVCTFGSISKPLFNSTDYSVSVACADDATEEDKVTPEYVVIFK